MDQSNPLRGILRARVGAPVLWKRTAFTTRSPLGAALGATAFRLCFSQCPLQVLHKSEKKVHENAGSLRSPSAEREKQVIGLGRSSADLVYDHSPSFSRGKQQQAIKPRRPDRYSGNLGGQGVRRKDLFNRLFQVIV